MTLFELLTDRREEILERCRVLMTDVMGSRSSNYQLDKGLPTLYAELVEVLRISMETDSSETKHKFVRETVTASSSRQHAQESYRLGYTVSQLVHGYGCICQGITEYAHDTGAPITSSEFSALNLCLDVAIAQAVTEFELLSLEGAEKAETLRLGFLVHELRNYLASATMAHELIRGGGVGAGGATSAVLTNAHLQMRNIIDRAMAEVRLRVEPAIDAHRLQVFALISEIESSLLPEANVKAVSLIVDVDPSIEIEADRHLIASAISNLVQNGIKFTKPNTSVWVRAKRDAGFALIEIEDRCGGLHEDKIDELFKPFVRGDINTPGMGLGLSIARRAIELNGGTITARNLPGIGCIFAIRIPAALALPTVV